MALGLGASPRAISLLPPHPYRIPTATHKPLPREIAQLRHVTLLSPPKLAKLSDLAARGLLGGRAGLAMIGSPPDYASPASGKR